MVFLIDFVGLFCDSCDDYSVSLSEQCGGWVEGEVIAGIELVPQIAEYLIQS